MLIVRGLNNAWMVDCLYTPDAAGMGLDGTTILSRPGLHRPIERRPAKR